jgi:hypothetical protein
MEMPKCYRMSVPESGALGKDGAWEASSRDGRPGEPSSARASNDSTADKSQSFYWRYMGSTTNTRGWLKRLQRVGHVRLSPTVRRTLSQ